MNQALQGNILFTRAGDVGRSVEQRVHASHVGGLHLEQPGCVSVLVDQFRRVSNRSVNLSNDTGQGRINIRCGFNRFDNSGFLLGS